MGIQGLLPLLKSVVDDVHISQYRGQRVAIDGYCWLHKGVFACAMDVCLGRPTTKYVAYCMHRVRLLQHYGVIPVVVLDGAKLPSKAGTEEERKSRRDANKSRAQSFLEEGNHSAAMKCFQKACDITPDMARQFVLALRQAGVEYIVAPYEADAQLAYLCKSQHVAAVISEDSDLVVFGCTRVLFKMDKHGHGKEIKLSNLNACQDVSFFRWPLGRFQQMCIFSGCDYLPSLPGMGLKKAHALLQSHATPAKAIRELRFSGKFRVPKSYEDDFKRAFLTFRHQVVYDTTREELVHLNPLDAMIREEYRGKLSFLGSIYAPAIAREVARGNLNPDTKEQFKSTPPVVPSAKALTLPKPTKDIQSYFIQATPATQQHFRRPRGLNDAAFSSTLRTTARHTSKYFRQLDAHISPTQTSLPQPTASIGVVSSAKECTTHESECQENSPQPVRKRHIMDRPSLGAKRRKLPASSRLVSASFRVASVVPVGNVPTSMDAHTVESTTPAVMRRVALDAFTFRQSLTDALKAKGAQVTA